MIKWDDIIDKYMNWLDSHTSFSGFLIRQCSIIPGVFGIGIIKVLKWIDGRVRLLIRKPLPNYPDNEYMVQDWRGMVMTQEEHRSVWGFPGYPATHYTDCSCEHCEVATLNFAESGGYFNVRYQSGVTRRVIFDYLNDRPQFEFIQDFLPKKKIKSHKLVERKYTMRRPGVYTREVDYSTTMFIPDRGQFTEIFGQPE